MNLDLIEKNSDFIVNQVELKNSVLAFLESTAFLVDFQTDCHLFEQNQSGRCEPLLVNLNLKFGDIEDANILYLITKEPASFISLLEDVLFCCAKSIFEARGSSVQIVEEQIHCNVRFYDLPLIPTYKANFYSVHPNRALSSFRCCIFEKSPTSQYVRQTTWKCPKCYKSENIIRRHRNNEIEGRSSVLCEKCLTECVEIVGLQVTSKYCSARVYDTELLDKASRLDSSLLTSIKLHFHDDLCQDFQLGKNYFVTGVFENFDSYIVWNIVSESD